jgi:2-polyprenyl-3-methyl-5-hydroxy-6-metoxy-1,4-benzoquinol methylase
MNQNLRQHPFGFWEIAQKPDTQALEAYYANKYYQEGKGSYELEYTEEELRFFRTKLEQRFAILERSLPSKLMAAGGTMLDVGCGEGYALAFFREKGWSVKGFDFSSAGIMSKNPSCGDALVTGDVFSLLKCEISAGRNYEVVWLQNVLEHVIDPIDLLAMLRTLVAPGGILVITVPNDFSIIQQAALDFSHIDRQFWIAPPDHLNYFDYKSLLNTSTETGWECLEMLGGFPVDWFLFHSGSNYIRDKALGKAAHLARIQLENVIHSQPIEYVLQYWSVAAKLGIGRDITAFLKPLASI